MITLVSQWFNRGEYSELRYVKLMRFCDRWLVTQETWLRIGKPSETVEYIYDIDAPHSGVYEVFQGRCYVFNNREDFFAWCTLDESNIVDGVPHFNWASYCELNN
jgi:hypothetical protein